MGDLIAQQREALVKVKEDSEKIARLVFELMGSIQFQDVTRQKLDDVTGVLHQIADHAANLTAVIESKDEFYRIAFRKKLYGSIEELQADLDRWLEEFNRNRPHQGRWCFGKTPMQTFLDAKPIAKEKMIAA